MKLSDGENLFHSGKKDSFDGHCCAEIYSTSTGGTCTPVMSGVKGNVAVRIVLLSIKG